jgi:hypothetical protein
MPDPSSTPFDGTSKPSVSGSTGASWDPAQTTAGTATPPGWYPTLTGGQQYWDGEKWLDLPPPSASVVPSSGLGEAGSAPKRRRVVKMVLLAGVGVLFLALIGGGIAAKNAHDSSVAAAAAEKAATQSREQQQRDDAAAAAASASRAAAAKAAQDNAEKASRRAAVAGIEASVKTMAENHAADGTIRGPIMSVTCSPVAGGSTDDLTAQTTAFACFVANKDNGDGTMSGYNYHATMNWSTGSYTYGFGAS